LVAALAALALRLSTCATTTCVFLRSLGILVFELILPFLLELLTHNIDDFVLLVSSKGRRSLLAATLVVGLIELGISVNLASFKVVLVAIDRLHVLSLVLVLLLHLVVLDGLVELFVLQSLLLLLKSLDSDLLLEQTALDTPHVVISFEHLSEEIVGSRYGHFSLDEEFHALHDVVSGQVIAAHGNISALLEYLQGKLALDVVVDGGQLSGDLDGIFVGERQMLCKRNTPLLLHQLG
jgi:hypothetical protein